jgi:hypothetical protein
MAIKEHHAGPIARPWTIIHGQRAQVQADFINLATGPWFGTSSEVGLYVQSWFGRKMSLLGGNLPAHASCVFLHFWASLYRGYLSLKDTLLQATS